VTSRTENADTPEGLPAGYLVRVAGLVSCGVIGFEIGLIRVLQYASWYHFAFLVITIALLGFGMSGAILSLWRGFLIHHRQTALPVLTLLTAISIPLMLQAAQLLPVSGRFLPGLVAGQLAWWVGRLVRRAASNPSAAPQ